MFNMPRTYVWRSRNTEVVYSSKISSNGFLRPRCLNSPYCNVSDTHLSIYNLLEVTTWHGILDGARMINMLIKLIFEAWQFFCFRVQQNCNHRECSKELSRALKSSFGENLLPLRAKKIKITKGILIFVTTFLDLLQSNPHYSRLGRAIDFKLLREELEYIL